MTLRTLNYGNYGIFLIMGNAGFRPSTVWIRDDRGLVLVVFFAAVWAGSTACASFGPSPGHGLSNLCGDLLLKLSRVRV